MDKSISILDKDYALWVKDLVKRYRRSQINDTEVFHQVGGIFEIPWRHHCLIMDKVN